jgi:hypothetical protein
MKNEIKIKKSDWMKMEIVAPATETSAAIKQDADGDRYQWTGAGHKIVFVKKATN